MDRAWQSIDEKTLRQVAEAMEAAGVAGLCEEGRLEIGMRDARRLLPQLDEGPIRRLVDDCAVE